MYQALETHERKATATHFMRRAQTGSNLTEKIIIYGGRSPHALKWRAVGRQVGSEGPFEEATFVSILEKVLSVGEHSGITLATDEESEGLGGRWAQHGREKRKVQRSGVKSWSPRASMQG